MKRFLSGLLIALFLLSLCACSNNANGNGNENADPQGGAEQTESNQPAAVGDTLSKPEKTFDATKADKLYLCCIVSTDDGTKQFEFALDQVSDEMYLLYVSNGLLKNDELVYEVGDKEIKKYEKSIFQNDFSLVSSSSYNELRKEVDTFLQLVYLFTNGLGNTENIEYKKLQDFDNPGTGIAWAYDAYENGEKIAEIKVDQKTGLFVKIKTENGDTNVSLQEYKLSGDIIPAYK